MVLYLSSCNYGDFTEVVMCNEGLHYPWHIAICISYNTAARDLPDIYARARGRTAPEGECVYIRQIPSQAVL